MSRHQSVSLQLWHQSVSLQLWHVYLAVWNLLLSLLTEADGGQARQVEAGRPAQQRRSEQPKEHFYSGFSQNGHKDGNVLGIIHIHSGRPQPTLQLGREARYIPEASASWREASWVGMEMWTHLREPVVLAPTWLFFMELLYFLVLLS